MKRLKLTLEFDGKGLVGWQRQDNGPSVQQILEEAIERFAHQPVRLHTAGRTDAGVHALGLVAHVDLPLDMPARKVLLAINQHTKPHRISVRHVEEVDEDFHARFSCLERAYIYRICNRPARPALEEGRVWWIRQDLDADAMHAAAQTLLGKHDFSTFRASQCQADSPIRTLDVLDVAREGEEIRFHVRARSFLHHQVRNFVGTLKLVGEGKWTQDDFVAAFKSADRTRGGPTAPSDGLYFLEARY